jgi:hypothetical protein
MTSFTREWLMAEAAQQGLHLDEVDAEAIYERVAATKAELARIRPDRAEDLEPVYRFVTPDAGIAPGPEE